MSASLALLRQPAAYPGAAAAAAPSLQPQRQAGSDARPVLLVVGTRPEALKTAPVMRALAGTSWAAPVLVTTGQHGTVVDEALAVFGLAPDVRLSRPRPDAAGAGMSALSAHLLRQLGRHLATRPYAAVVVQGDTASALAGAQAAFSGGVPVVHLEAGLRSGDLAAPFPEEGHRRLIAQISSLHLAPTEAARRNLLAEGVAAARIVVTGNTVVDALRLALADAPSDAVPGKAAAPVVVVTAHRRENWGEPIRRIGRAVAALSHRHPQVRVLVAAHMNPVVRDALESSLRGLANVELRGPVDYRAFVRTLAGARLVITDSGGIQEEAAALGVPVLVTRGTTERVEGVAAGVARLVGTDEHAITAAAAELLTDDAAHAAMAAGARDLYGDGRAAARVVAACARLLHARVVPAPAAADGERDDGMPLRSSMCG